MRMLGLRAAMKARIRAFFHERAVLEVETPALSSAATTDPNIDSYEVVDGLGYLHTSPEFPMKRLLAAGSGDIYQMSRVFRRGEAGRNHNPEFSLLEWYRLGFDHHRLMAEVAELVQQLADEFERTLTTTESLRYAEALERHSGVSLDNISVSAIQASLRQHGVAYPDNLGDGVDAWLDLLMSTVVCEALPAEQLTFIYDYPSSQASLARVTDAGASRFELYWGALELANGFHELTDSAEQGRRFAADNAQRSGNGQTPMPVDTHLLAALSHGLPDCAGVALGLDRLLMKLTGATHLDQVIAFPRARA